MWNPLKTLPPDPIFGLDEEFRADPRDNKVYLALGLYFDENAQPVVFPAIKEAATRVQHQNHNYLPIRGHTEWLDRIADMLLPDEALDHIALQQCTGGSQTVGVYGNLVNVAREESKIYIGIPTWGNHIPLLRRHELETFSHWDGEGRASLENYLATIEKMSPNDTLLIHGGRTHNPTGQNFSIEDLDTLIPAIQNKGINCFIDFAYWGYGDGWEADRLWVEKMWKNLEHVAVGISWSKSATLYRHRLGTLLVKAKNAAEKQTIESNMQALVRAEISMAPAFGAELMMVVFNDKTLLTGWQDQLDTARISVDKRRQWLVDALPPALTPNWEHARGMFAITNLTAEQILKLREDHGVYMPRNGRVNFAGVREGDVEILKRVLG
jgi:aspartate/tyrosine/aromatic aminotransferase